MEMEPSSPSSFVPIHVVVLPGGELPVQCKPTDIGFDVACRALLKLDGPNPPKDIWDFISEPPVEITDRISTVTAQGHEGKKGYLLYPNETILIGLGFKFIHDPERSWHAKTVSRSSTSMAEAEIRDLLAGVPIDPGFTGEPKVFLKNHGSTPFELFNGKRVAQLVFEFKGPYQGTLIPKLIQVLEPIRQEDGTNMSLRGERWNGSSDQPPLYYEEPFHRRHDLWDGIQTPIYRT